MSASSQTASRSGHGLAPPAHQVVEHPPDLAFVDDARGPAPGRCAERTPAGEDGEGEAVEGADLEALEIGRAFLHLLAGSHVERHETDRGRVDPPVADEVAGPLGEDPGLARSRRCDDAGAAAAVGDGLELVGGQVGRRRRLTQHRERTAGEVDGRDDRMAEPGGPIERAAVAPSPLLADDHVAGAVVGERGPRGDRERGGTEGRAREVAAVDVVGEQQMVESLAAEIGVGREIPVGGVEYGPALRRLTVELDHHPFPAGAGVGELLERTGLGGVDPDPGRIGPGPRRVGPRGDDQPAAELRRTGEAAPLRRELDGCDLRRRWSRRGRIERRGDVGERGFVGVRRRIGRVVGRTGAHLGHRGMLAAAVSAADHARSSPSSAAPYGAGATVG